MLTLLLAICAGCRSLPASGPVDFSEPGWMIRQGQAVWHPKPKTDIAGELLVAMHPDGRSVVQFSKPPLPFVEAQRGTNSWRIRFFAQNKEYAGRGRPPDRIGWLQLPDGLAGRPMDPNWSLIPPRPDGTGLHFENLETKETLDGFLATIRLPEKHLVRPGETLSQIARWYDLAPASIQSANPGPIPSWLKAGNRINLPRP